MDPEEGGISIGDLRDNGHGAGSNSSSVIAIGQPREGDVHSTRTNAVSKKKNLFR